MRVEFSATRSFEAPAGAGTRIWAEGGTTMNVAESVALPTSLGSAGVAPTLLKLPVLPANTDRFSAAPGPSGGPRRTLLGYRYGGADWREDRTTPIRLVAPASRARRPGARCG